MNPFDLEAAKKGAPVCTKSGRPVRILCFDMKVGRGKNGCRRIVGLERFSTGQELIRDWNLKGRRFIDTVYAGDLVMADNKKPTPKLKRKGYVNIYDDVLSSRWCGRIFDTEKEATEHRMPNNRYITTKPIEWEE